jgi:hypothetical protein
MINENNYKNVWKLKNKTELQSLYYQYRKFFETTLFQIIPQYNEFERKGELHTLTSSYKGQVGILYRIMGMYHHSNYKKMTVKTMVDIIETSVRVWNNR